MQINTTITLARVSKITDLVDHYVHLKVDSVTTVTAEEEPAGMRVFWEAYAQNVRITTTFIIRKNMYRGDNFILHGDRIYEIVTPAKGARANELKLHCRDVNNEKLKVEIKGRAEDGN